MGEGEKHHKEKEELSKSFYEKGYVIIAIFLMVFALYNLLQISSLGNLFEKRLAEVKEAAKPAKIQLVAIHDSNCEDCFNIAPIVDSIKKANINITKEENIDFRSDQAKKLIDIYTIGKIPTVLLFGEINKTRVRGLEKQNDALVLTQLSPPYTDAESGKIIGRVSAVIIKDSSCGKCRDLSLALDEIKKLGVKIISEDIYEKNSKKGQELISKYSIDMLPVLVLSKDFRVYGEDTTKILEQVSSVEDDGSYVTREISPPYLNLSTNKVVGLVSMTVISDNMCDECYDAGVLHKSILERMGVVLEDERNVDISSSEGKSLRDKYRIEKVPTIILSGDLEAYPVLISAWKDVGTVESDGKYVFRKVEFAEQPYKDIAKDKIISPQTATTS